MLCLLFAGIGFTQAQGYSNPVLSGFFPDPSVCRVGDDYYMVNSSFQFFPGVPVHHSKDLIHWEAIGHCLTRPSQVDLEKMNYWLGIYAPTIRHHEGTFYMITTNVPKPGQLLVRTDNPAGEWSEAMTLDQSGIDPDLFFDEDGKCYLLSADGNILLTEIDIATGEKLSATRAIWKGTGGRHPEAPHMYKKDGWYYLMIAEGGTEYGHKVTISRSRSLDEPFQANPANPILTHINSNASSNPIQGTGHADIIQAHDGSWWLVALAFRPQSYSHHLLGRETFLAPVCWGKDAWPVVNGDGTIALQMDVNTLPRVEVPVLPARNEFTGKQLGYEWNYLCNPHMENYSLTARPGYLRLTGTPVTLDQQDSPTFVGRRQQHIRFSATTSVDISRIGAGGESGITVYMSNNYRYDLSVQNRDGRSMLVLTYILGAIRHIEKEIPLTGKKLCLRVEGENDYYNFSYSDDAKTYHPLGKADTRFLSSETAGGFTGIYLGLFAQLQAVADFDWFEYKPLE